MDFNSFVDRATLNNYVTTAALNDYVTTTTLDNYVTTTALSTSLGDLNTLNTNEKTNIVSAINEVWHHANYWTLLSGYATTTSYVTVSTYNSRKISDCTLLCFTPSAGGWARNSSIVPVSAFNGSSGCAIYIPSSSGHIEIDIKPKTDTSFEVKYIGTTSATIYLSIFGMC